MSNSKCTLDYQEVATVLAKVGAGTDNAIGVNFDMDDPWGFHEALQRASYHADLSLTEWSRMFGNRRIEDPTVTVTELRTFLAVMLRHYADQLDQANQE